MVSKKNNTGKLGQSLIELLIGIGVLVIMISGAVILLVPALRGNTGAMQNQTAGALGKELIDNVAVLGQSNWHAIDALATSSQHYYLVTSSTPFTVASGDETVMVGTSTYVRYFVVDEVVRDGSGAITTGVGTVDPSTRKITVSFSLSNQTVKTYELIITRNQTQLLMQTDWSRGGGQDGPATSTNAQFSTSSNINYASTTGAIRILGL